MPEQAKEKLRMSALSAKRIPPSQKGAKRSLETKKLISEDSIKNPRKFWLGKKLPEEMRRKISQSHINKIDKKHPWNWKGGIECINKKIRDSLEYRLWREAIFQRDKYTCIWCGQVGRKLNADHIKPFCDYPELRFAIDNGRTLCEDCHKKTETYGNKNKQKRPAV